MDRFQSQGGCDKGGDGTRPGSLGETLRRFDTEDRGCRSAAGPGVRQHRPLVGVRISASSGLQCASYFYTRACCHRVPPVLSSWNIGRSHIGSLNLLQVSLAVVETSQSPYLIACILQSNTHVVVLQNDLCLLAFTYQIRRNLLHKARCTFIDLPDIKPARWTITDGIWVVCLTPMDASK